MADLLPTHHCFDDALEFIAERVKESPSLAHDTALILVHGIARATSGPHVGELYAHAWCEEEGHCWDAALLDGQRIYYSVAREELYAARQVEDVTRYTIQQACLLNLGTRHYGPWVPRYRSLCGGVRVMGAIQADASHATIIQR
jgi:hypothetical protein